MADEVNGKLDEIITKVGENSEKLENIEILLVGDVKDSKTLGLLERIRNVEKWIEKREWFEKLVIGAIAVNILGLIFLLIQNSLP